MAVGYTEQKKIVVIGAGLVGLAVADALLAEHPEQQLVVIEKESAECLHQSGRNSGVIHSGVYYAPGSKKAENCRAGKRLLEEFCEVENIPWRRTGKVIVATSEAELPRLKKIKERGEQNGVKLKDLSSHEMREIEPHVAGLCGLYVEETGIVDYKAVAASLVKRIKSKGGEIFFGTQLTQIISRPGGLQLATSIGEIECDYLVNCAGLYSDKVCRMAGIDPEVQICPFRGEYYLLKESAKHLCRTLIYPVPDPNYPFLGVHFTSRVDGSVECGPNAVLALAREGYTHSSINFGELFELLQFSGFRKFAKENLREGTKELVRSLSKGLFTKSLQKLVPEIQESDILPAPSGVRAQALLPNGKLVDDFLFKEDARSFHVLNAPSPAATSCLSIGRSVARLVLERCIR